MSRSQRGMVLVTSLLLLVVVTLLALGMFRSYGVQARIAGNIREKQRALQAAISAQQYGEWWLSSASNSAGAAVVCNSVLDANMNQGQICTNPIADPANHAAWNGAGVDYKPPGMTVAASGTNTYAQIPRFYITDIGTSATGSAEVYKVTAVGFGGSPNAVAVVESTYAISSGVSDKGGL